MPLWRAMKGASYGGFLCSEEYDGSGMRGSGCAVSAKDPDWTSVTELQAGIGSILKVQFFFFFLLFFSFFARKGHYKNNIEGSLCHVSGGIILLVDMDPGFPCTE
jgi:hypothetical protein